MWANEPHILPDLLSHVWIATPHIAGHALEGKLRGTWMIARALSNHLGVPMTGSSVAQVADTLHPRPNTNGMSWDQRALAVYDVRADDQRTRQALTGLVGDELAAAFDQLRDTYPPRREIYQEEAS